MRVIKKIGKYQTQILHFLIIGNYGDGGWFRLFGKGLYWRNTPIFSQRSGLVKVFRFKGWYIFFRWIMDRLK